MKKIRFDLDALKVESFVTSKGVGSREGTVFGMEDTYCENTCNGVWPTCIGGGACDSGDCHWTEGQVQSCTGTGGGGTALCTAATCPTDDTCEQTCGEVPETCAVGPCGPEK